MGKNLITQRRGRGGPKYRFPSHRATGNVEYLPSNKYQKIQGQVIDIIKDPMRSAPVARILLENFEECLMLAPEGMQVGQWVSFGYKSKLDNGCVLPLGEIPEGTGIYNIEVTPGDGGKLVRAAGTSAYVVSHERGITYVRLPSKRIVELHNNSRATIGRIASGGRNQKPMVHAGKAFYKYKSRNKQYPHVSGTSMNACNHPHGGGYKGNKPYSVKRNTPPGAKVGHIAPKRTGRKKRG